MTHDVSIGLFIKNKRKEKGLTLEQVGNYVGVSKGTVSRWESNEIGNMRTNRVNLLCECLDISTSEFLELYTTSKEEKISERITPRELQFKIKKLLDITDNLTEQEKRLLIQTLDVICLNK